jgi:UDP-glucose 4-epimerase
VPDVLVLGADGFIGSHLCDALRTEGHSVRAFDRFPGGSARNLQPASDLELVAGDFLNRSDLEQALTGVRFVVHLVSTTTPATSGADPVFDVETNVRGSVELFDLCVKAGVERVMFASTGGAIYGRELDRPLREGDVAEPVSPYAIGKLAIEGYLRFYRQAHGLDSIVLRVSNPYGERQPVQGAQGAVPIFLRRMLLDEPITVFGDGSMVRDYVYVRDLTTMMSAVLGRPALHHCYNLGSGSGLTVLELLQALEEASGVRAHIEHAASRPTDVHRVLLDTSRFEQEFGVRATTTLTDGLAATAEYVRGTLAELGAVQT